MDRLRDSRSLIAGRLWGAERAIWLDQIDFHAAAKFCRLLGRSAMVRHPGRQEAKTNRNTRQAPAIGLEGAKGGRGWCADLSERVSATRWFA